MKVSFGFSSSAPCWTPCSPLLCSCCQIQTSRGVPTLKWLLVIRHHGQMEFFGPIYWVIRANGSRWKTFHLLTTCSGIVRGDQVPCRQSLTFELATAVNRFILLYAGYLQLA